MPKLHKNGLKMSQEDFDDMIETHVLGIPARMTRNGVFMMDADVTKFMLAGGTMDQLAIATDKLKAKVAKLVTEESVDRTAGIIAMRVVEYLTDMEDDDEAIGGLN